MGPTVWELEGPMPILKSSKRLVFTVIFTTRSLGGEQLRQLYRGPVRTGFFGAEVRRPWCYASRSSIFQ